MFVPCLCHTCAMLVHVGPAMILGLTLNVSCLCHACACVCVMFVQVRCIYVRIEDYYFSYFTVLLIYLISDLQGNRLLSLALFAPLSLLPSIQYIMQTQFCFFATSIAHFCCCCYHTCSTIDTQVQNIVSFCAKQKILWISYACTYLYLLKHIGKDKHQYC